MSFWKWSKTANSNATADSTINWAEGMAPSAVNDSARAVMAAAAKYRDDVSGNLETGGSSTAYTITTNQSLTTLTDGFKVTARMHATSGATPTLAVDGLTAKQIRSVYGTNVPTGALLINSIWSFTYDSSDDAWIAHGAPGGATLLSAVNITGGTALTAPATDDELPIYDLDATANKKITLANLLKIVNSLTEDTTPDNDSDFLLTYDASASAVKKVLPYRLGAFGGQLLHVRDEKSAGTEGGGFSSGSWVKRDLNTTKTNEIAGASIASSVITLPAGTYFIRASAPAIGPNSSSASHKLKLRNTSDGSDTLIGTSEISSGDGAPSQTRAFVEGRFTIAAEKNFELQHRTTGSRSTDGQGKASNLSVVEVYADCMIWKVL
jgi:hypothetical protein